MLGCVYLYMDFIFKHYELSRCMFGSISIIAFLADTIFIILHERLGKSCKNKCASDEKTEKDEETIEDNVDCDSNETSAKKSKIDFENIRSRIPIGVVMIISVLIIIAIYKSNIFTPQDIDSEQGEKYIGQMANGKPDGLGTLYDSQNRIKYIGRFCNGKYDGKGRGYSYKNFFEGEIIYLKYDGSFDDGLPDGEIEEYELVAGEEKNIYSGDYRKGERTGEGTAKVYDSRGNVIEETEGFWYNNKNYGYIHKTKYDKDAIKEVYQGNAYENYYSGKGVLEVNGDGGKKYICGTFYYDQPSGECIVYDENGIILEQGEYKNGVLVESHTINTTILFHKPQSISERKIWLSFFDDYQTFDQIYFLYEGIKAGLIAIICVVIFIMVSYYVLYIGSISFFANRIKKGAHRGIVLDTRKHLFVGIIITVMLFGCIIYIDLFLVKSMNGNKVIGFFDSNMTGYGVEYGENDYIVRCGKYENGRLQGEGREYKCDLIVESSPYLESMYEGSFYDGRLNGRGEEYHYSVGGKIREYYSGSYSDGARNGYGSCITYNEYGFEEKKYEGVFWQSVLVME